MDFMEKTHNCFKCNNENTLDVNIRTGASMESFTIRDDTIRVEATFISKNEVEVEYNCRYCRNKNKINIKIK